LLAADSHMLVIDQQAGVKVFDMGKNLTYDNLNYSVHILCPNVYSKSFMQSGDFVEINNEVRSFALDQGIDLPDPDYIDSMDIAGFHLAVETYQKLGYLYR
jgi:hypothetical protein